MKKLFIVRPRVDLGKPLDPFELKTAYTTRAEAEEHLPTSGRPSLTGEIDFAIEELDAPWIGANFK